MEEHLLMDGWLRLWGRTPKRSTSEPTRGKDMIMDSSQELVFKCSLSAKDFLSPFSSQNLPLIMFLVFVPLSSVAFEYLLPLPQVPGLGKDVVENICHAERMICAMATFWQWQGTQSCCRTKCCCMIQILTGYYFAIKAGLHIDANIHPRTTMPPNKALCQWLLYILHQNKHYYILGNQR